MNTNEIEVTLKNMIVERLFLSVTPDEIQSDLSLIDEYGVDSVSLLELVVGLEETFGIIIEDSDFDVRNFSSVTNLRDFVQARKGVITTKGELI